MLAAALCGVAQADPREHTMLKGPYLQDLAPTSITVRCSRPSARAG